MIHDHSLTSVHILELAVFVSLMPSWNLAFHEFSKEIHFQHFLNVVDFTEEM